MANIIKLKQSSVADKVPIAGDLVQGELAINTNDEKIYTKNSSGSIVELGKVRVFTNSATEPASPSVGDAWFDPSNGELVTRVKDTSDVSYWYGHTPEGSVSELDAGTSQSYVYAASDIYDAGDAASAATTFIDGGTA